MRIRTGEKISELADEGNYNYQSGRNPHKDVIWVSVEDILKHLRTIQGGYLKSRPDLTISSLQKLIKDLENS